MNAKTSPDAAKAAAKTIAEQPVTHSSIAADFDNSGPANVAAATDFSPSGAPHQVTDIEVAHPAVDNDPRAGTTENMNRIDFNDPVRSGSEVVEQNLKAQPEG